MTVKTLVISAVAYWSVGGAVAIAQAEPVTVIATLTAAPGKDAELKSILVPLADAARKEPGCVSYSLLQNNARAGQFFTYETWADKAAIETHLKGPGIAAASKQLRGVLVETPTLAMATKIS